MCSHLLARALLASIDKARKTLHARAYTLKNRRVILVKNHFPLDKDSRVLKEVCALKKAKFSVTFLSWDRLGQGSTQGRSDIDGDKTIKLELGVHVNRFISINPILSYFLLPVWWGFVLKWLLKEEWDIAHVINFQSIIPSIIAGNLKGKPVIYEIEDTWFDQMSLPSYLRPFFLWLDKFCMHFSSAVILVDELQKTEFGGIPNKNVTVVYDSAIDLYDGTADLRNKIFTIFYAGEITKYRKLNLDKIVEAVKEIDGVQIIFAGGRDVDEIKKWAARMPNKVYFIGRVPYSEVLQQTMSSDLLFVLRDDTLPIHKYICGSKIFEAMMSGKPILVSKGTSTAMKVSKEKIGLVVDPKNIREIRSAILALKENQALYDAMGKNARKAYDNTYGWHIMERRLIDLYCVLVMEAEYEVVVDAHNVEKTKDAMLALARNRSLCERLISKSGRVK